LSEAYRRQRIRTALTRAGHLVLGQPAGPFAGGARSDLIACLRPFGIFGAIEVKDKGKKPTRAQQAFGAQVERSGGVWVVGTDPEEVLRNLEQGVATILTRRAQNIPEHTEAQHMPIDIDDLFTNPPPPLTPDELAGLVDETEPPGTNVPITTVVAVHKVTINGTVVDPELPEAAAKVMGYESVEAREQIDPSPARKRSHRRAKTEAPAPPEAGQPQESAEPATPGLSIQEEATADQNAADLANGTATRDQMIADLDARDARLNGESTPFDEWRVIKQDYERVLAELGAATAMLNSAVQSLLQLPLREG
jgi:hypothetical protein